MFRLERCHAEESRASEDVLCFWLKAGESSSRSLAARFLTLRLCSVKMSSFFGRGRDVDGRLGLADCLGPAWISDWSCEVKARVFDEDISRDDFCRFAGLWAPYKGASFVDVFRCDILMKVKEDMTKLFGRCGVDKKKVWTAAGAPKPLHHGQLEFTVDMVLEKLHLPLHLNTQQAEYCIRPLSEMPTPRQVYVAVIGMK
jgi:hypothetical protein